MSNWIKWNGGKCPVAKGTLVDVKYRNGEIKYHLPALEYVKGDDASFSYWKNDDMQRDIVEYRLSESDNLQHALESDNKYNRQCKGVTIDVYDVLLAFNVTNPALQHLVKKALCTGLRGHKDKSQDLQDILDSAKRALELESDK